MAHAKRLSKRLTKFTDEPLSKAQHAVARMFGYNDWHELEQVTDAGRHSPSLPDYILSSDVVVTRLNIQSARLKEVIPNIDAYSVVRTLAPSGTMPWGDQAVLPVNTIFPATWEPSALDNVNDPSVKFHVVDSMQLHLLKYFNEKLQENGNAKDLILPERGFRVLTMSHTNGHYHDIQDGLPPLMIIFRLSPTITENVITGLEIEFHPMSVGSEYLNDDQIESAAMALAAYLHHSNIHPDSPGEYCGASTGLIMRLTGLIQMPVIVRFVDTFHGLLDESFQERHLSVQTSENEPFMGDLPVAGLIMDCEEDIQEEAIERAEFADATTYAIEKCLAISQAMNIAPTTLSRYLKQHGHVKEADTTVQFTVKGSADWPAWLSHVRELGRQGVIPASVSIAIRHHFVDYQAARNAPVASSEEQDDQDDIDATNHIQAARQLKDDEMVGLYVQYGMDAIFRVADKGDNELGIPDRMSTEAQP
jgi:hypothetical protein